MTDIDQNGHVDTATGGHGAGGFAALAQNAPSWDDGPWRVHGVALGEDDVTEGVSGKRTHWPREALEDAAEGLVGKKIVNDLDHDDLEKKQPSVDTIVGEVTAARYEPGTGIVYDGELDDPDIAKKVERGRIDVSPMLFRRLGEFDDERDAYTASEIVRWRDLATVAEGASPSASIESGAAAAMQAAALRAMFDGGDGAGGEAVGAQGGDEAAESARDGRDDDPETAGGASTGGGGGGADADADTETPASMELTDSEEALVREARTVDQPVVVSGESEALLNDAAQYDDLKMVESSDYEALSESVDAVKDVLGEALAERTGLTVDTAKGLELEALMAEFEDEDGDLDAEALVQSPEAGGAEEPDEPEQPSGAESLSSEERDELRSLSARAETFDGVDPEYAESLREDAAELAGVDAFDDIEMEAL